MAGKNIPDEQVEQEIKLNAALTDLLSSIISPTTSFDEMYQIVLEKAQLLTESQHGFVSSIEQETGAHISNTLTKMQDERCPVHGSLYSLPNQPGNTYYGLWGHSLNTQDAFFTNSPATHPAAKGLPAGHLPLNNFLSVPVKFGGNILGQIALANSSRDYNEEDLRMVERIGELYAVVLHNRQTENELRRNEERFRLMVEAAPFPMVVSRLSDHTVLYINPSAEELLGHTREAAVGFYAVQYYVHPEQRITIIDEVKNSGRCQDIEVKLQSVKGRQFWAILSAVKVDWFGNDAIVFAINDITDRKNMEEELKRLATMDSLTNLLNRRHFMEMGHREFELFSRYKRPFSIIIFDLDNFKQVNDSYGHQTGDRVLLGTSKIVIRGLRINDIVGRYGGEEFAVILPETFCEETLSVAERLRQAIANRKYSLGNSKFLSVTASFGVCEVVGNDRSFEDIISRADKALYKAKAMGRNLVYSL